MGEFDHMTPNEALQWADKNCQPKAVERLRLRAAVATLASEVRRLRVCLREHAKWADKAAMVVATIEAENDDESEQLHAIVEGLSTWIPAEIMGTNVEFSGLAPLAAEGPLDCQVGPHGKELEQ